MLNSTKALVAVLVCVCLSLAPHVLQAQSLSSLPTQTAKMRQYSGPENQFWQGWSLTTELGVHFKRLDFSQEEITLHWGHDKRFWGEFGALAGVGFKYGKVFKQHGYFGCKLSWTFFYPDLRWTNKGDITLSSIPLIGKFIRIATDSAGYLSMLLVPVMYFDIGYITEKNILFSVGSAYLWGLSPGVTVPLTDQWSLEVRSTFFLDRIFFDRGYHNFLFSLGVNYKL